MGTDNGIVAVTGGTGFVGSAIVRSLTRRGHAVRVLSRSRPEDPIPGAEYADYRLGSPIDGQLDGAAALIHAAHDFTTTSWSAAVRMNVEESRSLFDAATLAGVTRLLFVSSVAAFPDSRSKYGRSKLLIEEIVTGLGGVSVRPGLVWDEHGGSLAGSLNKIAQRLPLIPILVAPDTPMTLIHVDDLAEAIAELGTTATAPSGVYIAGSRAQMRFDELLRSFTRAADRDPRFVRLPWRPTWLALRLMELLHLPAPFRSDSLLSLANADLDPFAHAIDLATLGYEFRPHPR